MVATIRYQIEFYDDTPSLQNTETIEIQSTSMVSHINYILIPYEHETWLGIEEDNLWFDLDVHSGLEPYD